MTDSAARQVNAQAEREEFQRKLYTTRFHRNPDLDLPPMILPSGVAEQIMELWDECHEAASVPAPAPSEAPHFPIALNDSQEQCVKIWAVDMRCWATPETVEFNLRTFARKIIGESGQPGAPSEAKPSVTEAAKNLLHAMDTCHVCGTLLEVEGGPVYCKDGCTRYCDAHEGEECESISALHQKLRDVIGSEANPATEEK